MTSNTPIIATLDEKNANADFIRFRKNVNALASTHCNGKLQHIIKDQALMPREPPEPLPGTRNQDVSL